MESKRGNAHSRNKNTKFFLIHKDETVSERVQTELQRLSQKTVELKNLPQKMREGPRQHVHIIKAGLRMGTPPPHHTKNTGLERK